MAGPVEDVVAVQKDALLPLWAVLGIVTGAVVLSLLVKLYTVLTIGKCSSNVDMAGKTVIITGANTGIGKETARELARRNARVILACRNMDKAGEAAADICASTGRSVALMQLDLCSLHSVRQFAAQVVAAEPRLDVLILNAGMMCVTVNCCHPGFVRSEIAVRSADTQTWLFNLLLSFYGKTVKEGAETTVYLAVSEDVQNVSGQYFKDCAPTFAVPWATNPAAAKKLYEESIRLTQVI